jgi:predicted permease
VKLIDRLVGRGDAARGREMLDDAAELARERRARRGRAYAAVRLAWDVAALIARPVRRRARRPRTPLVPGLADELRWAWRAVRRRPVASAIAAGSLGIGLGLAILTLTIVDAILIRPLGFPASDELVAIFTEFRPESGSAFARSALSPPEVLDYGAQSETVAVAAFQPLSVAVDDGRASPERVPAARMTSGAFRVLATPPLMGRALGASDDRPGAPCSVVLSHGFWQDRLGADAAAIGRALHVDGLPCTVAGVMPREFAFPNQAARLWLPLAVDPDPNGRGSHGLFAVGRLKPGSTLADARDELAVMMARWTTSLPHHRGHGIIILPLKEDVVGRVSQELRILAAAVTLLLLSITANLSSLLLASGSARRRELAVRSALGAARGSLARQLLFEGGIVAALGGLAGAALAWTSVGPVLASYPAALPRSGEVQVDLRTIALALALTGIVGLLVAWLPALRLTRRTNAANLNAGDRQGGLSLSLRTERVLVVGQLAVGVAVGVGALLLTASYQRLAGVPLGFDPSRVTAGIVGVGRAPGRGPFWPQQFFDELTNGLAARPGVAAAGAISSLPLVSSPPPDLFTIEGRPVPPPSRPGLVAHFVMITPGAFEALGVPVLRGRGIARTDTPASAPVAVVNERMARLHWPESDPIGQRLRYPEGVDGDRWTRWGPWITIVGIVGDMRSVAPAAEPEPAIYVAHVQRPRTFYEGRTMGLVVRTARDDADAAAIVRERMRAVDPRASVTLLRPMEALVGATVARPRFMRGIMAAFAAIAVLVAALGVYGVVAYAVERRTREIGLRIALGASRGRIAAGVARQTLVLLASGLLIGLLAASWLASMLATTLFNVAPFTAAPYGIVASVLTAAVALAVLGPARRATRVDPLIAMRAE